MEKFWKSSHVMREFEKVAAEQGLITNNLNPENKDFVGNPSKKPEVIPRYDATEEYDVTKHDNIVEKAHPKTTTVADAMGSGGVVENIIEQQNVSIDVATKMPNGALHGVHAELIKNLVREANKLEQEGKIKEAQRIDKTLQKLALPFNQSHLVKEAFGFSTAIGLLAALAPIAFSFMGRTKGPHGTKGPRRPMGTLGKIMATLGGAFTILSAFGNKLTSRGESLIKDTQDLYNILIKCSKESKACKTAADLLVPFLKSFQTPLDSEKNVKKFIKILEEFEPVKNKIKTLINRAVIKLGPGEWWQSGFNLSSRLQEKFNDVEKRYNEAKTLLKNAEDLGNKMDNTAKQAISGKLEKSNEIKELQRILFRDDPDKLTGEMDQQTINATKQLEENIDNKLKELNINESVKGALIKDNKLVTKPKVIKEMLTLIKDIQEEKSK